MMVVSWNVNGLRSIYKKNFLGWFKNTGADIICLQEVRATKTQLSSDLVEVENYSLYFNASDRKGYAGVAVYTKDKPLLVEYKIGFDRFDKEGRIVTLKYSGFILVNVYLPHGGRSKENLGYKLEAYKYLLNYVQGIRKENIVVIGDFNVAHSELDLARPKQNKKNTMFTEEERKQIDELIKLGFVDTFRKLHQNGGYYTWWPYFANARARNLGWRIDYAFVSKAISSQLQHAFILEEIFGSDHCPIGIEI